MDASWITLATGLIAGLGIGSVITAQIQHALKIKEAAHESQRRDLEARYRVIILLMYAAYDFTGNETAMRIHRPDLKTQTDVLNDLRAEWTNMLLFASKSTLDNLRIFIGEPTANNLAKCAVSMRVDLGREAVDLETLNLNLSQNNSLNRNGGSAFRNSNAPAVIE